MKTKICIYCEKEKLLTEKHFRFRKDRNKFDNYCIFCDLIKKKQNYQDNKERYLEYSKIKYYKLAKDPNYNKEQYLKYKDYHFNYDKERNKDPIIAAKRAKWAREYRLKMGMVTGNSQSKEEQIIESLLKKKGLRYEIEKTFKDCINSKTKCELFFDFYVPYFNLIIEYDGIVHYKPIYGEETLEDTQYRDRIKNQFCKNRNINLLRIPYWKIDNIEVILQNHFIQLKQAA